MSQADLEILITPRSGASYGATLRFRNLSTGQDKALSAAWTLQEAALRSREHDPAAYGEELAAQLLAAADARGFLDQALAVAASQRIPLRLRLFIGDDAAGLHALHWETLRLPGSAAPLAAGEWVRFSRYLDSDNWLPVKAVPQAVLRALVAIASPDVSGTTLAEVRTEQELGAARAGLAGIPATELAVRGQVTLPNLMARLRDGCDILYLVAHGMFVDGEPHILLEQSDGGRAWTPGRELTAQLGGLAQQPGLIVLVSCQSAGADGQWLSQDGGALAGLGPRLAAAGVPAVVAMQGHLTMATAAAFMPQFLAELSRDGQVDRAMAVARSVVLQRPDWWMPVLFTRLLDGRVWLPGSSDALLEIERQKFEPETIYIPGGSFQMGSPPGEGIPEYETPRHEVITPAYRIGKYLVTNREYAQFLKAQPGVSPPARNWLMRRPPAGKEDHPVVNVSWRDARAYCDWLAQQTGRTYRLPTEAEWEKAARGRENRRYPWGDTWHDGMCNMGGSGTTPVTAFEAGASSYGCCDMLGNVEEWTHTIWGSLDATSDFPYPYCSSDGREDPDAARQAVIVRRLARGGSYASAPDTVTNATRVTAPEEDRLPQRGFRVAVEINASRKA